MSARACKWRLIGAPTSSRRPRRPSRIRGGGGRPSRGARSSSERPSRRLAPRHACRVHSGRARRPSGARLMGAVLYVRQLASVDTETPAETTPATGAPALRMRLEVRRIAGLLRAQTRGPSDGKNGKDARLGRARRNSSSAGAPAVDGAARAGEAADARRARTRRERFPHLRQCADRTREAALHRGRRVVPFFCRRPLRFRDDLPCDRTRSRFHSERSAFSQRFGSAALDQRDTTGQDRGPIPCERFGRRRRRCPWARGGVRLGVRPRASPAARGGETHAGVGVCESERRRDGTREPASIHAVGDATRGA